MAMMVTKLGIILQGKSHYNFHGNASTPLMKYLFFTSRTLGWEFSGKNKCKMTITILSPT